MEKLTSIKLQPVMNIKNPELDLLCPVLSFGKKKTDKFKFPIVFKDETKASELYNELEPLIGQSLNEVKQQAVILYQKYKKFDYRIKSK